MGFKEESLISYFRGIKDKITHWLVSLLVKRVETISDSFRFLIKYKHDYPFK